MAEKPTDKLTDRERLQKLKAEEEKNAAEHNAKQAKLAEEKAQLLEGVKNEILAKIQIDIEELATYGLTYSLIAKSAKANPVGGGVADKECPVCGFKTSPLHDGRQHRANQNKGPFKDEDLKRLGYIRV
jgi:DNA repair exonuclease SbcCD ATPase subunit